MPPEQQAPVVALVNEIHGEKVLRKRQGHSIVPIHFMYVNIFACRSECFCLGSLLGCFCVFLVARDFFLRTFTYVKQNQNPNRTKVFRLEKKLDKEVSALYGVGDEA